MDPARARELLARERARAERQLAEFTEPVDVGELSHIDQHPADDPVDLFEEGLERGLAERLREEFEAIERAERRPEEGTYGISVVSGKPIPDARLEVIPWAERTAEEQEAHERSRS